jgi:hypothetical protein
MTQMNETELRRAVAEAAKNVGSEAGRSALAEIIVKTIEPNFLTLDLFRSFMPVRQLNPGDNVMHKVRKGKYPVRSMVPGSMHLVDTVVRQDKSAFMFDQIITGTQASLWELQSGDLGTVAEMRREFARTLEEAVANRVFNLLTTVWSTATTPNYFTDASSTGVTRTVLDNAVEEVLETSPSVRAIIGTRKALNPIYDFATSVPVNVQTGGTAIPTPQFTDYFTRNLITTYKGIPVVEIRQQFENTLPDIRAEQIRNDTIVVIGEDAGTIALMGGVEYQDYTDYRTQPANYVLHAWQQYALLVDAVDRIHVIKGNT